MLFWRAIMETINITNPEKILFNNPQITKMQVANYYLDVAPYMLPFVQNRVLSVIRCHDGINGECFFKKHPQKSEFVESFFIDKEEYFYIKNVFQIISQVQNGTLEFHTTPHNIAGTQKTSIMVFDLDPDTTLPHRSLCSAVMKIKQLLDELNLTSFLKTSGGKGFHIAVPFKANKNADAFYDFAKNIALLAESKWPNIFTTNIKKNSRKGKIFVDYLRNNENSTCVCPFSLRARENAPISFPIAWNNLEKIAPNQVNLKNYKKFLNNSWDIFFKINQKIN